MNMVMTEHGPVPGCTNEMPCEHARMAHDVANEEDPLPQCAAYGCPCGHPPLGYRRALDQRTWQEGETVPAGVPVMDVQCHVYPPAADAWVNVDHGPLIELQEDRAGLRKGLGKEHQRLSDTLSFIGIELGHWAGRGDWAKTSEASKERSGARALRQLDTVIADLGGFRERLAGAVDAAEVAKLSELDAWVGDPTD